MLKKIQIYAAMLACGVFAGGSAVAQDALTVVSFGGAYGAAQQKHQIDPFVAKTGTKILFETYSGGVAELKAQVQSGNILWDVVDFETIDLERACSEGLLEVIPRDILLPGDNGVPAEQDFIPGSLDNECGIAVMLWSAVYAYDKSRIGATVPTTIADFFDTKKIPGKRAMRKRPQINLEWALLADGVAATDVYEVLATPEGQTRAFAKLATIKDDIVWFDSWSQAPGLINDGGAALVQTTNGRLYTVMKQENKPFEMVWDGNLYDSDTWAIVKGTPNRKLALDFIAYTTGTKPLAGFQDVAYGPPRKSSLALIDPAIDPYLPSAHISEGMKADGNFWSDYGEALGEKFNEWLIQ